MFDGPVIAEALREMEVTDVIWIPDSTTGLWEQALERDRGLRLLRVCREGEVWPLAGGLLLGGRRPLIVIQTTGLFESGDALRNVVFDLQLPVFALIGARNWGDPQSPDSARQLTKPLLEAWGLPAVWLHEPGDLPLLAEHYRGCWRRQQAGLAVLAE